MNKILLAVVFSTGFVMMSASAAEPYTASASKIYIGAGPVISYAIGGKWKSAAGDTDVKFGSSDTDDFKPLDLGLGLGAGLEISSFQIGVNYNLGLSNISPQSGTSFKNNVLGISVAYLFGGKK